MKYATFPYDTVELENGHLDFTFKVGIRIPVAIFSAQHVGHAWTRKLRGDRSWSAVFRINLEIL